MLRVSIIAGVLLASTAAHAFDASDCDLFIEIIPGTNDKSINIRAGCPDVSLYNQNVNIYSSFNLPQDAKHICVIDDIEKVDRRYVLVHSTCPERPTKDNRSHLVFQIQDNGRLLITNAENY